MIRFLAKLGIVAILFLPNAHKTCAQPERFSAIDSMFSPYFNLKTPGYALGIVQNGQLVYSKGYGSANLDYGIPLSDSSAFYIASMAKQFTTAALLLLESEGKIDFEAPIQTYLPDFPDYGEEITISHLIHHTSGIRESNSLQLFQGIDKQFEAVFDTNDLVDLLAAQKELNFSPGEEFRYSSGGYAILAKIVEKVSGQPLRLFLHEKIFSPLGMADTIVADNHNEVVNNRAVSYWPLENGGFERRSQIFEAYGDGGIITTVRDLAKWDKAFYTDLLGVQCFAEKMYQKGKLNNGEEIEYARALQIRNYKGLQMVTHNGGMLGFRVDVVRFPEVNTSIILLGNSAYLDPTGKALAVADVLLEKEFNPTKEKKEVLDDQFKIEANTLAKLAGHYWTDEANYFRRVSVREDSLFLDSGNPNYANYLKPLAKDTFEMQHFYLPNKLIFKPEHDNENLTAFFGSTKRTFRRYNPEPPSNLEEVLGYTGKYYSSELSATYTIYHEKGTIQVKVNNNRPFQIFPVDPESSIVWNSKRMLWIGYGEIKFEVDSAAQVKGFTLGDRRVTGVHFVKVD